MLATVTVNAGQVVRAVNTQLLGVNVNWWDTNLNTSQTRQMVQAAGLSQWDLGLSKNFRLAESATLQFRGEFFNVFNRVNFLSDDGSVGPGSNFSKVSSKGSFGALTVPGDPRIGQIALKLIF